MVSGIIPMIGTKTKQQILGFLSSNGAKEFSVKDMHETLDIPESTLSKNLDELRVAGILSARKDGKYKYYSMNKAFVPIFKESFSTLKKVNSKLDKKNVKGTALILILTIFMISLTFNLVGVEAAAPQTLNVQGKLTNTTTGASMTGLYNLTFRIYNQPSGGSSLWMESQDVNTVQGVYDAVLGLTQPLTLDFDTTYYLSIEVNSSGEMDPRVNITSTPHTYRAKMAENLSCTNCVALTSETTGNYVSGLTEGSGINITGTAGEGWSPIVALNQSCDDGQILKWDNINTVWNCSDDSGAGGEADTLQTVTTRGDTTTDAITIDSNGDEETIIGGNLTVASDTLFVNNDQSRVGIGTDNPKESLQLGVPGSSSTATPETISLGGTYSNAAGANPKFMVWTNGATEMGLGVSSGRMDYILGSTSYDHVFYSTSTNELVIIDGASGNVGINDTTPDASLEIINNGIGDSFLVADNGDGDSTPFVIQSDGDVGIGTTSPGAKLDISQAAVTSTYTSDIRLTSTGSQASSSHGIDWYDYGTNWNSGRITLLRSSTADNFHMTFSTRGTADVLTERVRIEDEGNFGIGTTSPDSLLDLNQTGYEFIDLDRTTDANVDTIYEIGVSYAGANDDFIFLGVDGQTDDFVITDDGNVGIGTTDPGALLDVSGNAIIGDSAASSYLLVGDNYYTQTAGGLNPGVYIYKNGVNAYGMKLQYTGTEFGPMIFGPNQANRFISFGKVGAALEDDDMVEYMRIDLDNGNVGIGTTDPNQELEVVGDINATGDINTTGGDICIEGGTCLSDAGAGTSYWTVNANNEIYNGTTDGVGIGTNDPGTLLEINGTNPAITLNYNGTNQSIIKQSDAEGLAGTDLRIGLDESLRTMIISDVGDIDVDFGLTGNTVPTIYLYSATMGQELRIRSNMLRADSPFYISGENIELTMNEDEASVNAFRINSATNIEITNSAGAEQAWLYVEPKVNQGGTSNYVGILLNVTETGVGSGDNMLLDLRVEDVSKFSVDNSGNLNVSGNISMPTNFWIGNSASAPAANSIAIGDQADASAQYTIAIGYQAESTNTRTIAIGPESNASAANGAIAIGYDSAASGLGSQAVGYLSKATALESLALGYQANATANYAIAIGDNSDATNSNSIALGLESNANGSSSIAVGDWPDATANYAIAIGRLSNAAAQDTVAIGRDANANTTDSTAVGHGSEAEGSQATAIGALTDSKGSQTVSLGYAASAPTSRGIAIGTWADAIADDTIALGYQSNATEDQSTALGSNSDATGTGAVAIGYVANATENYVLAVGYASDATGSDSTAIGPNANANGTSSTALGTYAEAEANSATALGSGADAKGIGSVALGYDTDALSQGAISLGYQAQAIGGNYAVAMGWASDATALRTLALGYYANATETDSIAIGPNTDATGAGTAAVGASSNANGSASTAIGATSEAEANSATAIGYGAEAMGQQSTALGTNAQATAQDAIAISYDSHAYHTNTVALGRGATTTSANQFMVGSSSYNLNTYIYGSLNVTGNLTPSANNTYYLGTPDYVWKEAYFGPDSVYIGDKKISNVDGELRWPGTVNATSMEILSTLDPQFRISNTEGVDYADFTVDSDGNLTIQSSSGGNIILQMG